MSSKKIKKIKSTSMFGSHWFNTRYMDNSIKPKKTKYCTSQKRKKMKSEGKKKKKK